MSTPSVCAQSQLTPPLEVSTQTTRRVSSSVTSHWRKSSSKYEHLETTADGSSSVSPDALGELVELYVGGREEWG